MFENISFQLSKDQKIAIVARNGAGKTTLFNILREKDSPDSGTLTFHKDISIGFLEQDPTYNPEFTVLEQVLSSSGKTSEIIENYEHALITGNTDDLQKSMELMDLHQAWDIESRMTQILGKLKITDLEQKMKTLSGGQRKRVALANALVSNPDLLILDEPTNHLDLEMIEWLEDYLVSGKFTLLMVTHDRYFLDRICNCIVELDNKSLFEYKGNYSYYLEKRAERLENDQINVEKAKNLFRKELDWIRRMPQARGTKAKYRVDAFEDVKEKAFSGKNDKKVNINVQASRLGSKIINVRGLNKSFDSQKIVSDFSYNFARNEKIGIIGNNGTGKSSLLNMLTGSLKPDSGTIDVGETLKIGYYKQDGLQFDENLKVIEVAQSVAEVVSLGDGNKMGVTQFLNYFLFPPEVQYSFVYKLSGGEKRRLYLMTILMQNPNFLILDEPTNDLDIVTLNVLENYLADFQGCTIIVSHDRYFMDKLVEHIFIFEGDGKIKDFPGNYSDYRKHKELIEKEQKAAEKSEKTSINVSQPKNSSKKMSYKEQREYVALTKDISTLELEKKNIESEISIGNFSSEILIEKSQRIAEIIALLDTISLRWLELSELAG